MRSFHVLIFAIMLFACGPAEDKIKEKTVKIDQLATAFNRMQLFEGSLLVASKGKVLFSKSYGLANREWNLPNTVQTKFRIASLTKLFTAVLIMQLKQAGKLDLQAPVTRYLPGYRSQAGNRITIHHLLTHTSGIPDYTSKPDFFSALSKRNYSPIEFVNSFCSGEPEFEPGTKFSYCNSGYYILGAVIEAITGNPYAEVLKSRVLDVAGMRNSGMDDPSLIVPGRASGYHYDYGKYSNADFINTGAVIYAAGGMYSTVEDMLLWNNALSGDQLLSKANRDTLFTPFLDKYAYGIAVSKVTPPGMDGEVTFMTHTGGINGFRAFFLREEEDDELVIVLGNSVPGNFSTDLNPLGNRIWSILHDLPYDMPKQSIGQAMGAAAREDSIHKAISLYQTAKREKTADYDFTSAENDLNTLGYFLLGQKRIKDAIEIFRLNTAEFPASANTYDSYAEALAADGQREAAIKNYRRSLELNPGNTNAKEQLKKLQGG